MTEQADVTPDLEADAAALEQLRLDLLKAGPTSGLHRHRAHEADQLLIRTRDFYRSIIERRRERIERQQKKNRGELL